MNDSFNESNQEFNEYERERTISALQMLVKLDDKIGLAKFQPPVVNDGSLITSVINFLRNFKRSEIDLTTYLNELAPIMRDKGYVGQQELPYLISHMFTECYPKVESYIKQCAKDSRSMESLADGGVELLAIFDRQPDNPLNKLFFILCDVKMCNHCGYFTMTHRLVPTFSLMRHQELEISLSLYLKDYYNPITDNFLCETCTKIKECNLCPEDCKLCLRKPQMQRIEMRRIIWSPPNVLTFRNENVTISEIETRIDLTRSIRTFDGDFSYNLFAIQFEYDDLKRPKKLIYSTYFYDRTQSKFFQYDKNNMDVEKSVELASFERSYKRRELGDVRILIYIRSDMNLIRSTV